MRLSSTQQVNRLRGTRDAPRPTGQVDHRRLVTWRPIVALEGGYHVVDGCCRGQMQDHRRKGIVAGRQLNPEAVVLTMNAQDLGDPTAETHTNTTLIERREP